MLTHNVLPAAQGGKPDSLVVILHGLGDSGEGIMGLGAAWRKALPTTEFIAPNAPFPCDMGGFGYQWFSVQDRNPDVLFDGVKAAAPILNATLDALSERLGLPFSRIALVGFSQGCMMSLYVAPRRAEALAGVIGYSGSLFGGESLTTERRSSPPFLLSHGMQDDVVPFASLAKAESGLKAAGLAVETLARPNLPHSIDDEGLEAGVAFLKKVFA